MRLHDVPLTIISDRDTRFVPQFFKKKLHKTLKTKLNFNTTFYPQMDK